MKKIKLSTKIELDILPGFIDIIKINNIVSNLGKESANDKICYGSFCRSGIHEVYKSFSFFLYHFIYFGGLLNVN